MSQMPVHRIADISYKRDRVVCACGWAGKAKDGAEWAEHRREVVEQRVRKRGWTGSWSVK